MGALLRGKNCYAYACNDKRGPYAEDKQDPGDLYQTKKNAEDTYDLVDVSMADVTRREINEAAVISGIKADNKIRERNGERLILECDGKQNIPLHYLVALIVSPLDYHWYRQDCTGYWSEKSGHDGPNNLEDGKLISSPTGITKREQDGFGKPHYYHMPKGGVVTTSSKGAFQKHANDLHANVAGLSPLSRSRNIPRESEDAGSSSEGYSSDYSSIPEISSSSQ